MKILLCNKFYYRRGGDCIYTMNLEQLLKKHGHEVAIFSQQYPLNEPSPWSKYWPSEFKMKPSLHMIDSLLRPFGLGSVRKCYKAILDDFFGPVNGSSDQYKDCVVHLNNIHTQLSPILAEIAHERGIRVIWTIHDSKLVCPCYTCMRDGKWCEECFTDKRAVLRHKCMKGGYLGNIIGYLEAKKWSIDKIQTYVDCFVCPSQFIANTLIKSGFDQKKTIVLNNFIDNKKVENSKFNKEDYYIYVGRVNQVKGLKTLCHAASHLPYKLIIVGDGELKTELEKEYKNSSQIEWRGQLNWKDIKPLLAKARFMILPSEWLENNPLSVIESLCLGTPVLGARIGGITELIDTQTNGDLYNSGDKVDLLQCIECNWNRIFDYKAIADKAQASFSDSRYYNLLMDKYTS